MKKIILIFTFALSLFSLVACGGAINAPANFRIDGDTASWDSVEGATKYRLEFVGESTQKRVVNEISVDLKSLNLPFGTYTVNVQAIVGDKESAYTTDNLTYEMVDDSAKVNVISEDGLTQSGFVKWMGRTEYNKLYQAVILYYSSSGFEVSFTGTKVTCELESTNKYPYVVIVVDGDFENSKRLQFTSNKMTLDLVEFGTDDGKEHKVALYKSTESQQAHIRVKKIETNGSFKEFSGYRDRKIEVIGDSVSAGFGNLASSKLDEYSLENTDSLKAFPFLVSLGLNAELNQLSVSGAGLKFSPYNDKNMFDAFQKVDVGSTKNWDFSYVPDLVIVELGTNDGYYIGTGKGTKEEFIHKYNEFLDYIHTVYPNAKIMMYYGGMKESNMYDAYTAIYEEAKSRIPDLGILKYEGDGNGAQGHPSAQSQKDIASAIIAKAKEMMNW